MVDGQVVHFFVAPVDRTEPLVPGPVPPRLPRNTCLSPMPPAPGPHRTPTPALRAAFHACQFPVRSVGGTRLYCVCATQAEVPPLFGALVPQIGHLNRKCVIYAKLRKWVIVSLDANDPAPWNPGSLERRGTG